MSHITSADKCCSYDLGVIAEVVILDDFTNRFLQTNGDSRSGTVVALFTAGCFCGAFLASFSDPLGRRGAILTACCIFVAGGIIQTAGVVIAMLYVGRLIAGIGVGILTMIIPICKRFKSSFRRGLANFAAKIKPNWRTGRFGGR